jgi:hypothetical protein
VKRGSVVPSEIAKLVVVGITLIGAIVWLFSLKFLAKSARLMQPVPDKGPAEPPSRNLLAGSAEVEGAAKTLANKAATMLAKGTLGPLKIVEKTDGFLIFERLDANIANQPAGNWFQRGELRFTALGNNRSRVEWIVEPSNFQWLLSVGGRVQVVGLLALVAGCWAMVTYVASSPEPAVRWQSVQMLQVIHVLWPPFLFGGLYRKGVRGITAQFDALANNLPYLGD